MAAAKIAAVNEISSVPNNLAELSKAQFEEMAKPKEGKKKSKGKNNYKYHSLFKNLFSIIYS